MLYFGRIKEAIELKPDKAYPRYELGECYARLGKKAMAWQQYDILAGSAHPLARELKRLLDKIEQVQKLL